MMCANVERTIRNFREIFYKGIPLMLQQNETSFLSFMCVLAATDALAAYRYEDNKDGKDVRVGERFEQFVKSYFPPAYESHAKNLYLFRCRVLHNFSPAYFTAEHEKPEQHLRPSNIGDPVLDDGTFFADMRAAAEEYFAEMGTNAGLQKKMAARVANIEKGGAIFFSELSSL